jgi:uncharacterized protein (DUF58 family)
MTSERVADACRRAGAVLTRRGWWLLSAAVGCLIVARVVGLRELYGLAAADLLLLAMAIVWAGTKRWHVDVVRRVQPTRVAAGAPATVDLEIRNRSSQTGSPVLTLRDPFDARGRSAQLLVAPLDPGQTETCSYELPATGRGVYTIGPLTLQVEDPFGLARRQREVTPAASLVVHPAAELLRRPVSAGGGDRRGTGTVPVRGTDNDEFSTLREYRPGDDLRRVHWASSARTETLLVREDQKEHRGRVVVVVDLRAGIWTAPALEVALGAAASITEDAIASGLQVRLITTSRVDTGLGSGTRHRLRIFDELAVAAVHGDLPPPATDRSAVSRLTSSDYAVVISSDRVRLDELRSITGVSHRGPVTLVLVERSARPTRHEGPSGRVVRVPTTATFGAAWDEAATVPR